MYICINVQELPAGTVHALVVSALSVYATAYQRSVQCLTCADTDTCYAQL
jgi:hypothetical protein